MMMSLVSSCRAQTPAQVWRVASNWIQVLRPLSFLSRLRMIAGMLSSGLTE